MFVPKDSILIEVATGLYPVYIWQVQKKTTAYSFGEFVDEDILMELGYAVVHRTDPPAGVDVREIAPVLTDGGYTQAYAEYVKTEQELDLEFLTQKDDLTAKVSNLLENTLRQGIPYNFGTETEPNIQHVQMRPEDRANLLGLKAFAEMSPNSLHDLRTFENQTLSLTASMMINVIDMTGVGFTNLMKRSWALKDKITMAVNRNQLPTIPTSLLE